MTWLDIFSEVCRIPHPSGQEAALAARFGEMAQAAGLAVRRDAAGNLAVDRPAAPGRERAPAVILQAHLDMVPQVAAGETFDFSAEPVPWRIDGDWINTGGRTTLGADNGIGAALILEILLNPETRTGPLRGVFTVAEETGLSGASHIAPEFLAGAILINLDSEEEGSLIAGCAGGMRSLGRVDIALEDCPEGLAGFSIDIGGLPGGHSGMDIARNRGNAIRSALEVIAHTPGFRVAELTGGTVDNAIPRECRILCALPPGTRIAPAAPASVTVREMPRPARVWTAAAQREIVSGLGRLPDGVIAMSAAFPGVVETSANLAALRMPEAGKLEIKTSQRSLRDEALARLKEEVRNAFASFGAACVIDSEYPAWTPAQESPLAVLASEVWRELYGRPLTVEVIHAGLETACFGARNPALSMISAGPDIVDVHSPVERASVGSVERVRAWLYHLLERLGR